MAQQQRRIRLIATGEGGTITFAPSSPEVHDQIEHVGIAGVSYGVGVSFRVSDNQAFAAHIGDKHPGREVLDPPSTFAGFRIAMRTKDRLEQEMQRSKWTYNKQQMRAILILVAPQLHSSHDGHRLAARYVVQGLCDFFGADGELRIEPHVPGFAVSMRDNVVQYLPFVLDSALSGMQDPERWKESTELAVDYWRIFHGDVDCEALAPVETADS